MILAAIKDAHELGARLSECASIVNIDLRTLQRWQSEPMKEDGRKGPLNPHNRLSKKEREGVIEVANSEEFCDLSPNQIVPKLADSGIYIASEKTFYRILDEHQLVTHRGGTRPRQSKAPLELKATGPCQVWSWDITYLRSHIRGSFFYLYMMVDIWSRKIVGWEVHEKECTKLASNLVQQAIISERADPKQLALHQDNGAPMKGATLKATLETLGVLPSYSRPRVSDDNPYSESLFRTLKYHHQYPKEAFQSIEEAQAWVEGFVHWYNEEHMHSGIQFVTPEKRHSRQDESILMKRNSVYEAAQAAHPERWSRHTRNWSLPPVVILNPSKMTRESKRSRPQAA